MIFDSETSNSDTKIKESENNMKISKTKALYLGIMCFATNCLSSIPLEAGSRGSFRSNSPTRPVIFNNLFRRNYNLRIKIMVINVLVALISTIMLTIGNIYGIPYLYLPWLINTIKGMTFCQGPALFELAYTVLPNASVPTGVFVFITILLYVEELCIWKDVFMSFKRCWTNYNKSKKLEAKKSTLMENKELYSENKESCDVVSTKESKDQYEPVNWNEFNNHNSTMKSIDSLNEFTNTAVELKKS